MGAYKRPQTNEHFSFDISLISHKKIVQFQTTVKFICTMVTEHPRTQFVSFNIIF